MTSRTSLGKTIRQGLCIVTILLLVIGCSSEPQTGQAGGPAPAVVEIWHSLQGAEAEALQVSAQRIAEDHPEVIPKLSYVPEKKFVTFSYQAEAGGEGPELFIASREIIRQLYEQGALAPVAYEDQEGFPAILKGFQYDGKGYGLPWLTDVPLLYFRTDTAPVPINLADLFSAKGGVSIAAADTVTLSAWWNGQGGRLINGGIPVLDAPNNVAFLEQLLTWQSVEALRIDPAALTAFSSGQTPYMIAGASAAKSLTPMNVPWGSILLSDLLNGQGQPLLGTTLGIANSAIKTNDTLISAIQIVEKALLTPEVEGAMMEAGGLLPANMGYYQRPEAQKGVFPQAKLALDRAWALEGRALEWTLIPLQDAAWSKALAGNLAPLDALVSAQEQARKDLMPKE